MLPPIARRHLKAPYGENLSPDDLRHHQRAATLMSNLVTSAKSFFTDKDQPVTITREHAASLDLALLGTMSALSAAVERIAALEARLEQVDARMAGGMLKYCGLHQRALGYAKGSVVTFKGSAWVAIKDAAEGETPGETDAWQLAIKAGRDGKDAAP